MKTNNSKLKEFIKNILQNLRLLYLSHLDIYRFMRTASFSIFDKRYNQVSARIVYHVHAIEKGLSRTENLRLGFGKDALSKLNDTMVVYVNAGFSKGDFAYQQGLSIISKYISFHQNHGFDVNFINSFVSKEFLDESSAIGDVVEAGTMNIKKDSKKDNRNKSFEELALGRVSIREFGDEVIQFDTLKNALELAMKTPSVCNRQGWKIFVIESKEVVEEVLHYQRGYKNYGRTPDFVLAITVSNSTFLSPVERNEAFVDGGLLGMSVLYALEAFGIGAVALNAMMNSKDEKKIRKVANIDQEYQISFFIAVGSLKNDNTVPISKRKVVDDIIVRR